MRNITHRLFACSRAIAVQPSGGARRGGEVVQVRRRRAEKDEVALLRWLGRSANSAVGLVRGNRASLTNSLFRELDQGLGDWRWSCGAHAALRYASLRHLACGEACDLLRTGDAVRTSRYERGDCALELRLERLPTATGPSVVVLAHDVSDQVRRDAHRLRDREARLHEERMHAMGVVASGLAHDLNHSLNVIALRLATLRADPRFEPAKPSLDGLGGVVDGAAATVARLQDLARRRRDRPAEAVDLSAVLLGAVEMARTELDGMGAGLHIEEHVPPLPPVRGTALELSHLFADLLAAARDSTPAGGAVEVWAREGRGGVVVTIADQGPGIPEENLARVFDPFFSSSETRETGLALSIAYGLMHRLGGNISAANRPGGGAVYILTFPLAAVQQPRVQLRPQQTRRATVLLVDDESDNLDVLEELLEMEGHGVETATSGKAALERFQRGERYDVVLCDVGMPQMSGWQVVREIRRIAPGARIWLLTGWANEISEHDPRLADVQGVLGKPLDLDRLRSLLGDPQGPTPDHHHALA
jgi:signal transduction histidine kinase/CheY-like chemotaxis protein